MLAYFLILLGVAMLVITFFGDSLGLNGLKTKITGSLEIIGGSITAIVTFLADFDWGPLLKDNPEIIALLIMGFGILRIVLRKKTIGEAKPLLKK